MIDIALAPIGGKNHFLTSFTNALRSGGFSVVNYNYQLRWPGQAKLIVFHWPDDFFSAPTESRAAELRRLLAFWRDAKLNHGAKLIWVAHNAQAHEATQVAQPLCHDFVDLMDGIIYLSAHSRQLIHDLHHPRAPHELVTRHGHYRGAAVTPPSPTGAVIGPVKLGFFGRIRRYKNLETLITCAAQVTNLEVRITGYRQDGAYANEITQLANISQKITLDFRDDLLTDTELEAEIDCAHGIVLPYRNILNSGSALMALSRHRPVLAPRLGGLGELQAEVGPRWLQLYEGELTPSVLADFASVVGETSTQRCDLAAYDWPPIAAELRQFVLKVCSEVDKPLQVRQYHPVRYWRGELSDQLQNLGDYLSELFLDRLFGAPVVAADAYYLIGSVITEHRIRRSLRDMAIEPDQGRVAFWGCGARGPEPLSSWAMNHATFLGVRGPLSRDILGLDRDTPLGDPALLLPLLRAKPHPVHNKSLCIVHFHEKRDLDDIKRQTGVDEVLSAALPPDRAALLALIDRIAGANFVLSGALHGAIVAAAYGVPFGFFDSGYIDVPFKWADFAASVGIEPCFVGRLDDAERLYCGSIAPHLVLPPLAPLLRCAPFTVAPAVMRRAVARDASHSRSREVNEANEPFGDLADQSLASAQAEWLEQTRIAFAMRHAGAAAR